MNRRYNYWGQSTPPEHVGPTRELVLGHHHTCALQHSGVVVCWGLNHKNQTAVPPGMIATKIVVRPAAETSPARVCGILLPAVETCYRPPPHTPAIIAFFSLP